MFALGFISFVLAILNFVGLFYYDSLIGILSYFLAAIWNWNFRYQTSEFPTDLLYFYIDIYLFVKWKHIQMAQ